MEEDKSLKSRTWGEAFKNAVNGIVHAFLTQNNFRVHAVIATLVIILGFWLKVPRWEFLILTLAITIGLTIEMANTAFEKTVDLVTQKWDPKAKIAKDVSAGMMLVVAFGLAILGALILIPPILERLTR
jgi:diacylglycerol kinase